MPLSFIGYEEALALTMEHIRPLPAISVGLSESLYHAAAGNLTSRVNAPSVDVSLKDGFAVCSADIDQASKDHPVSLKVLGTRAAGEEETQAVSTGHTVRILSGAAIPPGADAVVANEFTRDSDERVAVFNTARSGRNILPKASDVGIGENIVEAGQRITPGKVGLLAAAGFDSVPVIRRPKVVLVATGTEVVAPGNPLPEGKVFASNLMTLDAWCRRTGMQTRHAFVEDDADAIGRQLLQAVAWADAIVTSGGAWTSRKDWMARVLDGLGWKKVYHRVRMGPGKAVGFGLLEKKPVFILPGGPPSNLMAFLQIALPGLYKLAGESSPAFSVRPAVVDRVEEGQSDWTQFVFGKIDIEAKKTMFRSLKDISRLQAMSLFDAILKIPEGTARIEAGTAVPVQTIE